MALIKVVTPIDDTPAAKAGILAGDLIVRSTTTGAGHDPEPGGREDARRGNTPGQAHDHAQGPGQADRSDR